MPIGSKPYADFAERSGRGNAAFLLPKNIYLLYVCGYGTIDLVRQFMQAWNNLCFYLNRKSTKKATKRDKKEYINSRIPIQEMPQGTILTMVWVRPLGGIPTTSRSSNGKGGGAMLDSLLLTSTLMNTAMNAEIGLTTDQETIK